MLLALLLLPIAELAVFFAAGSLIGFLPALAAVLVTSLLGVAILRRDGLARIRMMERTGSRHSSALELHAANLVVLVAGCLLLLPGFLTDLAGISLLLAPRAISRVVLRRLFGPLDRERPTAVVDLDPGEWERVPERPIEDRRGRHPNS